MEPITSELSLGQRLAADTPIFFKKVELVGTGIAAVGGSLTQIQGIPIWLTPALLGIGAALMLLSKFAVKDIAVIANPNATAADYSIALADLPSQFEQLKTIADNAIASTKPVAVVSPAQIAPVLNSIPVESEGPTVLQQIASQQASSILSGNPAAAPGPGIPINPNVTL